MGSAKNVKIGQLSRSAMTSPPSRATRTVIKKKSRKGFRLRHESVSYIVRIEDWSWSLSFGVSRPTDTTDEFEDFRHLQIQGNLIRPMQMMVKSVELWFLPKSSLNEPVRKLGKRSAIGFLQLRARRLHGTVSMPADALGPLLNTLGVGRLRYVILSGDKIRYRRAVVRGFRFEHQIAKDELPVE